MLTYSIVKALHLIFIVTWFAGLFYIVRLFIYAAEANELKDTQKRSILLEQYLIMKRRLWYGITWPSAILTLIFGSSLLLMYGAFPFWMQLKLACIFLLYLYHFSCEIIIREQKKEVFRFSPYQLRLWNEVATLFLFAIVFTVILKHLVTFWSVVAGILVLCLLLLISIKIYASKRSN